MSFQTQGLAVRRSVAFLQNSPDAASGGLEFAKRVVDGLDVVLRCGQYWAVVTLASRQLNLGPVQIVFYSLSASARKDRVVAVSADHARVCSQEVEVARARMLEVSSLYRESTLILGGTHVSAAQVPNDLVGFQLYQWQCLAIIGCGKIHLPRVSHGRVVDLLMRLI